MKAEQFVEKVVRSVEEIAGLKRLRLIFADFGMYENVKLMGRGALDYSKHKDHRYNSQRNFIDPCHTDYTEHKNHC